MIFIGDVFTLSLKFSLGQTGFSDVINLCIAIDSHNFDSLVRAVNIYATDNGFKYVDYDSNFLGAQTNMSIEAVQIKPWRW